MESVPLNLVHRILIQTCCSSISYILVRVSIYRNNVKRMVDVSRFYVKKDFLTEVR